MRNPFKAKVAYHVNKGPEMAEEYAHLRITRHRFPVPEVDELWLRYGDVVDFTKDGQVWVKVEMIGLDRR